jgi:cytochrome b561
MSYDHTAVRLHWLVALLILATFPLGYYMADLPLSPWKLRLYSWHKWIGVTVFLLAVARVAWRAAHPAPAWPASMKPWETRLAAAAHALLYVLMLAVPLSGWLMSSAAGFKVVYLGLVPLPDLVGKDKALADFLDWVHQYLTAVLGGLVLLHVAAALKHRFVDRDGTLARMIPFLQGENR